MKKYQEEEKRYKEELRVFCKKRRSEQQYVGEVIKFPVADGYVCYMVANIKPLEIIHMQIGDDWEFQYADIMTKKK